MALPLQPAQVKFNLPDNSYNVIDNSPSGMTSVSAATTGLEALDQSPLGFDNNKEALFVSKGDQPSFGAADQDVNTFTNGTVPDGYPGATKVTYGAGSSAAHDSFAALSFGNEFIRFKNPA